MARQYRRQSGWFSVLMLGLLFWGYLDHVKAPHPISTAVSPEMEHRQKVVLNGILQEPKALQAGAVFCRLSDTSGSIGVWVSRHVDTAHWRAGTAVRLIGILQAPTGRQPWVRAYQAERLSGGEG